MSLEDHFDTDEWPPTDAAGNEYPIDWIDEDELDGKSYLTDSNGRDYSPFTGALEPIKGRCNAPVTNWRERYPSIRFCSRIVPAALDSDFCSTHRGREDIMKTAEEHLQTGAFSKTIDHRHDNLGPYQQLVGFGLWESLMGESSVVYAPEHELWELDFSDHTVVPDDTDEDGILELKVAMPTDHGDRALALLNAALDSVSMLEIQSQRMPHDEETGAGALEVQTTDAAQLTSPTEADPSQQFRTIEAFAEHHLNAAYSRLIRDKKKLLEYGGVSPDASEDTVEVDTASDLVLDVSASAETDDPAPNAIDGDPISEQVVDSAGSGDMELSGTDEYAEATEKHPSTESRE